MWKWKCLQLKRPKSNGRPQSTSALGRHSFLVMHLACSWLLRSSQRLQNSAKCRRRRSILSAHQRARLLSKCHTWLMDEWIRWTVGLFVGHKTFAVPRWERTISLKALQLLITLTRSWSLRRERSLRVHKMTAWTLVATATRFYRAISQSTLLPS